MSEGGVYKEWHETIMQLYKAPVQQLIDKFANEEIPRYKGSRIILDDEADLLKAACEAVQIEVNGNLREYKTFMIYLIKFIIFLWNKMEKELKPEDPYIRLLDKLNEGDLRNILKEVKEDEVQKQG